MHTPPVSEGDFRVQPDKRYVWIDIMRIVAAFSVIVTHGASIYGSPPPFLLTTYWFFFVEAQVSVFFFLSGLCLKPGNMSGKIGKLVITYLIWIFIALLVNLSFGRLHIGDLSCEGWLKLFGVHPFAEMPQGAGVLWFLRDLIIFYCLYPLLVAIGFYPRIILLVMVGVWAWIISEYCPAGGGENMFFLNTNFVAGLFFFIAGTCLGCWRSLAEWTSWLVRVRWYLLIPLFILSIYLLGMVTGHLVWDGGFLFLRRMLSFGNYVAVAVWLAVSLPFLSARLAGAAAAAMAVYVLHGYFLSLFSLLSSLNPPRELTYLVLPFVFILACVVYKLTVRFAPPYWAKYLFLAKPKPSCRQDK